MNRITKLTFLVTLLLIMLTLACSERPALKTRYQLEKEFFAAERLTQKIRINPDLTTSDDFDDLKNTFSNLVDNTYLALATIDESKNEQEYRTVEQIAFNSVTRYTQILFARKEFELCEKSLERLINKLRLPKVEAMTAFYNLGRTRQAVGDWDSAMTIYDFATERFYPPLDRKGNIVYQIFNLPQHLHDVTIQVRDEAGAAARLAAAEEYYNNCINDFPDTRLQTSARANLARVYENAGLYSEALEELRQLRDSSGSINPLARMRIADLQAGGRNLLDSALLIYDDLETSLTGSDTELVRIIMLKKALVYLEGKKYRKARDELSKLERDYSSFYRSLPQAQLARARSFEGEGNWERAESEYRFLIENFRGSNEAMSVQLYLINHYVDEGREREAEFWRERAKEYFRKIASEFAGSKREAAALSFEAELYRLEEDWKRAADTYVKVFERFPQSKTGQRSIVTAAQIHYLKLDDKATADSLLEVLRNHLTTVSNRSKK